MINDNIIITVVDSRNGQCKIAIEADKDVKIYREEIYYQIKLANLVGKNTSTTVVDSVSDLLKDDNIKLNNEVELNFIDSEIELDNNNSKTFIIKKKDSGKE